ncbi:MAG: xanthine dehydrogenase family protein molybdopterin-binding subunit [Thermodesulfobacteriota bacterium]|nr:xanthine dehydrogenase family protein molybdopterin-binding subunit [Thermodesulfobacteriota bacterium]
MNTTISRRSFLKITGLTIAVSVTPFGHTILNASEKKDLKTFNPNVWLHITSDNKITIYIGNSEMGQGVLTAQSMIIADELEADWKQIKIKQAPAADALKSPILGAQITVGSASMRGFYEPLRKAGAAGRTMLIKAAAETWNVPESECIAELGTVKHEKSKRSLTYGQLCEKAAKLQVPQDPLLKKESEFRYMGKPMPRVDVPEKVRGKAVYGLDVNDGNVKELKGMLYAIIARPPAYGAKPQSFDQKAAEQVKDVVKVMQIPMGIAVCATSTDAALKGKDALKVQWDKGTHPDMDNAYIEKLMMADLDKQGAKVHEVGDARKALSEAAKKVEATYFVPCVAHATMEPMNTTAYVQEDRCDIWSPNQNQTACKGMAAGITKLPPEKVHIHTTFIGCGLGRRAFTDFVPEAVIISKTLGKPVKVMWTREDDIRHDRFRAPMAHRVQGGLDAQGELIGWSHKTSAVSIMKPVNPKAIKDGVDYYCLWGLWDVPDSPHWNTRIQYEVPNLYIEFLMADLPILCWPWRAVQNGPNAFAIECFMDELAHAAGKDPLEFRLQNLKNNKRATRVLQTVAEKAGWGKPIPKGQGRGIAQHACFGTWAAQVVDLSVDKNTGKIKVHRVVAAVDCGPVINPGPLVEQIEGGVILAISTALKEEVKFANGGVASVNFDDYPILRMSEVPEIEVHIVKSTDKIGGIGELGVPPLAPAVANAFFNATGVRIRRIPLTPKTVMDAMKKT